MEPYGARVSLRPRGTEFVAAAFLEVMLAEIATRCLDAGATLIGHLKCSLRAGSRRFYCNLTSLCSGAACRGDAAGWVPGGSMLPEMEAELDLAVLVYGLPAATIDGIVEEVLDRLLSPLGVAWSKRGRF